MFQIGIEHPDGVVHEVEVPDDCIVGSRPSSHVHLTSWRVSKEHARLFKTNAGVMVEDLGAFTGVTVNGVRISTQTGPLKSSDIVGIGPFKLHLPAAPAAHLTIVPPAPASSPPLSGAGEPHAAPVPGGSTEVRADAPPREQEFEWRQRLHGLLLESMDLRRHDVSKMSDEELRETVERFLREILQEQHSRIPAHLDQAALIKQVLDEAIGLGPLEELLDDSSVTEIMVNQFDRVYVEREGRLAKHAVTFTSERAVMGVIERIVAPLGRRVDESSPMVDARLKDGSRVNAIIPPLARKGPCLTIRKFARYKMTAENLVQFGALSPEMAEFLRICVSTRKNILVSGGTGSGKTTLLNILSNFIPRGERIVTVEDAAELQLHHEHWVSLEARPANAEGRGAITIRELVKNTLRMRPDRIVVGECRGGEALDMLQAMNTGHDGSLTTLHANTPRDALSRLETMVLMAGMDLPLSAIREQIASAIQLIVQQTRFACGTRVVSSITEVTGMESGKLQLQELFRFAIQSYSPGPGDRVRGHFTGCDMAPSFYEPLRDAGQALDMRIFRVSGPGTGAEMVDGVRPSGKSLPLTKEAL